MTVTYAKSMYLDSMLLRKLWKRQLGEWKGNKKESTDAESLWKLTKKLTQKENVIVSISGFGLMESLQLSRTQAYWKAFSNAGYDNLTIRDQWFNRQNRWKVVPHGRDRVLSNVKKDVAQLEKVLQELKIGVYDVTPWFLDNCEELPDWIMSFASHLSLVTEIEAEDCIHVAYAMRYSDSMLTADEPLVRVINDLSNKKWKSISKGFNRCFARNDGVGPDDFKIFYWEKNRLASRNQIVSWAKQPGIIQWQT